MHKDKVKNELDFFKIPHLLWAKVVFFLFHKYRTEVKSKGAVC